MSETRIVGTEPINTKERYGQVYMATHKGEQRLPFMNRSFISFSFGSKKNYQGEEIPVNIEDFNLIATIENNRWNRQASSEFEDLVTEYNIIDGQFYWGTHFKRNKINFKLATDRMTQQQLEEFRHWFIGGVTRELILSEHPNRAILARVGTPPNFTLLPFEEKTTVKISGKDYNTSTTIYKGEIALELVMDMPFWYAKVNIFGHYDNGVYYDTWTDANGETINIFDQYKNLDVMKIVLEDNIPVSSMISISTLLGNNTFANANDNSGGHIANDTTFVYLYSSVAEIEDTQIPAVSIIEGTVDSAGIYYKSDSGGPEQIFISGNPEQSLDSHWKDLFITLVNSHLADGQTAIDSEITFDDLYTAVVTAFPNLTDTELPSSENLPQKVTEDTDWNHRIYNEELDLGAKIWGPYMAEDTGIENFASGDIYYFYYAGTAPSYPTIQFSLTPQFNNSYISSPANSYETTIGHTYNTISITSLNKVEFKFTTPNIYTSYNEAIKILKSISDKNGDAWENIRVLIRDNVKHHAVRAWANKIIDFINKGNNNTNLIDSSQLQKILDLMALFFNSGDAITSSTYEFNSETGKATGTFSYRDPNSILDDNVDDSVDGFGAATLNETYPMIQAQEDVSDMIKSNYLVIKDRNHPDESTGTIMAWEDISDYTRTYTHKLEHDVSGGLQNLYLRYKNMYL